MTIGVGLIGLGIMGGRMLGFLSAHEGFRIAAGWDPSEAARQRFASQHPGATVPDDAAALINDPAVSVVYIATPPVAHMPLANQAFDAGKAVFCEKPLGTDDDECAAAVARIAKEHLKAGVNFSQAHSPAAAALRKALDAGDLGDLESLTMEASFAKWPRPWQADAAPWLSLRDQGGFTREVFSHFLFLARRVLGPLELGDATVVYPEDGKSAETAMHGTMIAGGVPVRLDGAVRGAVDDTNRWTLTGSKGAYRVVDWTGLERRSGDGSWTPVNIGPAADLRPRASRAQLDQVAAMVEGRPHTLPSFAEALDVQRIAEQILTQ